MSITTEIQRLQNCVADVYAACSNKGAVLPQNQNSNNFYSTIQTIQTYVRDKSEISKYKLEPYDSLNGDITTRTKDINVAGVFNDIDEIVGGFNYAFSNGYYQQTNRIYGNLEFTKLKRISAEYAFSGRTFDNNSYATFPSLQTLEYPDKIIGIFSNTKNLKTINFPELHTLNISIGSIANSSDIEQILFPKLATIGVAGSFLGGNNSTGDGFYGCTKLSSVYFPSLITINNQNAFYYSSYGIVTSAFKYCTGLTEIHFRTDMQNTIENLPGYSSKFGATNATIYFDL